MRLLTVRGTSSHVLLLLVALLLSGCTAPVSVQWQTETEMETAGFNLFRGTSPDGPFDVKINESLIPPADDPLTGKDYTYVDRSTQPGVTYYYQLQEVERNGRVNTFGPISVRAGGFDWRHGLVLGSLAIAVVFLWLRGGRDAARRGARRRRAEEPE
jgi:hypothetical protein